MSEAEACGGEGLACQATEDLDNRNCWLDTTNWSTDATVAAATRQLMGSGCE